ncbi:hypothetical protein ACOMHN_044940 [Nucella lapillus]
MGAHRSGVVKAMEVWGGGSSLVQSPTTTTTTTTPRQTSKRDSGYHTDCSPATFTPTPTSTHATPTPTTHFTFDSLESPTSPLLHQGLAQVELPSPILEQRYEGDAFGSHLLEPPTGSTTVVESSVAPCSEEHGAAVGSSSFREERGSPFPGESSTAGRLSFGETVTTSTPVRHCDGPMMQQTPSVWAESMIIGADIDDESGDDDSDDDDAFVSDDVTTTMTSRLPESSATFFVRREEEQGALNLTSPGALNLTSGALNLTLGDHETEEGACQVLESLDQGQGLLELRNQRGEEEDRERGGGCSATSEPEGAKKKQSSSGDDDNDDECEEGVAEEGVAEEGVRGLASTAFYHGPLSVVRLPGGGRLRPLLARTTATQTPHLLCQLIRQVLAYPGPLPHSARGSALRRLRSYSEGEEETVAAFVQGPLPDLVPIMPTTPPPHHHAFFRERAHTCPDMEALQRQREAARAVGRELRRISDEFVRGHEARQAERQPPNWALAVLHAELNDVVVFVVRGVRSLLHTDFRAYLRQQTWRWTASRRPPARHDPPDSPVDRER